MPTVTTEAAVGPPAGTDFGQYLELLAGIGQDFAASLDIGDTLGTALSRIADYMGAEAASLFLLDETRGDLVCRACYGPVDIDGLRIAVGQGVVGRTVRDDVCRMVRDVRAEPDFDAGIDEDTGFRTLSILCAPLSVKDERVGAIELLNKRDGDGLFSDADRNALQVLASSAALAISNARLTGVLIEQEKLRRELELAAEIQRNLLPRGAPPGFPACGVNRPARGVSGDFYDHFQLADGRIGFCVGDVSGKGINAALLMAKTASLYHCLGRREPDPGALLATLNRELCETGTRGMFVTMVGGVYDPASGLVEFANAGHEPPLHRADDGRYTAFPAEAPPLGILPEAVEERYPLQRVKLDGGTFLVFTDGITEGRTAARGMLGADGLRRLLDELDGLALPARLAALVARFERPGTELHDDLTMLAVEAPGRRARGTA